MVFAASSACLSRCGEQRHDEGLAGEQLRDQAVRARGEVLYRQDCALCHGERGDGKGARVMGLDPKPASFTDPVWRTPEGATRAYEAITRGKPGTAMPAWGDTLSREDRVALVAYLVSVSENAAQAGRVASQPADR